MRKSWNSKWGNRAILEWGVQKFNTKNSLLPFFCCKSFSGLFKPSVESVMPINAVFENQSTLLLLLLLFWSLIVFKNYRKRLRPNPMIGLTQIGEEHHQSEKINRINSADAKNHENLSHFHIPLPTSQFLVINRNTGKFYKWPTNSGIRVQVH